MLECRQVEHAIAVAGFVLGLVVALLGDGLLRGREREVRAYRRRRSFARLKIDDLFYIVTFAIPINVLVVAMVFDW
jgi:hypothetical protein